MIKKKPNPKRVRAGKKAAKKRGSVTALTKAKISKSLKKSYESGKARRSLEKRGLFKKEDKEDEFSDDLFSLH